MHSLSKKLYVRLILLVTIQMFHYSKITFYLIKIYIWHLIATAGVIIFILCITNTFDTMQKFKCIDLSPCTFWQLSLLKIPYLFCEISSLYCFFATALFIRNLNQNNELIIIFTNGMPIWRIIIIPISVTFILGSILIPVISLIGTYGLREYERKEIKITRSSHPNCIVKQPGIFFFEKLEKFNRIIQAQSINIIENSLSNVTILIVDAQNNLTQRIDSPVAYINSGEFILDNATITFQHSNTIVEKVSFNTSMSIDNLIHTCISPERIPFWKLKAIISHCAKSGSVATKYQICYYKQLFRPFSMLAMVSIACWFIPFCNMNERNKTTPMGIVADFIVGIVIYCCLEITLKILAYNGVHLIFATLLPILFVIVLSHFVILHFQEG